MFKWALKTIYIYSLSIIKCQPIICFVFLHIVQIENFRKISTKKDRLYRYYWAIAWRICSAFK